ncbi:UNVERIFIED_CONTAM: Transcription factor I-like 1 [Sesamum radiatum]|uniref:Transcription factor I-like 1 n=1 Tax=Sesamum radiatum TaxID=300843 RepID=A0AAW2TL88_SESRA
MSNSSVFLLKQEFLKKWIKGLHTYSNFNKNMSIMDRKKAIKLSADVAIASTRKPATQWSRALMADIVGTNRILVEQVLGRKPDMKAASGLMKCSKKILRRSLIARRRVVPRRVMEASSIAKKLVKNRTSVLKSLVPGGEGMDEVSLIQETLDYIISLRVQVDVMRRLAAGRIETQRLALVLTVSKSKDEVMFDICMKGFMEGYYNWTAHGKAQVIEYYDDPPAPISVETHVAPNVATHWSDVE